MYSLSLAALTMIEESPSRREHLEKYTLMIDDMFCSPKFVRLRTLLPELVEKGHRMLIFSQWTRVMDLMSNLMESLDMKYLRLDGSTAVSERQSLINDFTNDASIPVFLLSTRYVRRLNRFTYFPIFSPICLFTFAFVFDPLLCHNLATSVLEEWVSVQKQLSLCAICHSCASNNILSFSPLTAVDFFVTRSELDSC